MSAEIDGTSKGLLGGFGFFTLASGVATLGYGSLLLYRYMGVDYNYGDLNLFTMSILLIVVGSLLLLTLLLGALGALKDLSNLRLVTLVLLFLLFLVIAGVGIYAMVLHQTGRLRESIDKDIQDTNMKHDGLSDDKKKKLNYLIKNYNCCSSNSAYDSNVNEDGIPKACCTVTGCNANAGEPLYRLGDCTTAYTNTKIEAVWYVAILALIAAAVVLLALILYVVLSQRARAGYAVVSRQGN